MPCCGKTKVGRLREKFYPNQRHAPPWEDESEPGRQRVLPKEAPNPAVVRRKRAEWPRSSTQRSPNPRHGKTKASLAVEKFYPNQPQSLPWEDESEPRGREVLPKEAPISAMGRPKRAERATSSAHNSPNPHHGKKKPSQRWIIVASGLPPVSQKYTTTYPKRKVCPAIGRHLWQKSLYLLYSTV